MIFYGIQNELFFILTQSASKGVSNVIAGRRYSRLIQTKLYGQNSRERERFGRLPKLQRNWYFNALSLYFISMAINKVRQNRLQLHVANAPFFHFHSTNSACLFLNIGRRFRCVKLDWMVFFFSFSSNHEKVEKLHKKRINVTSCFFLLFFFNSVLYKNADSSTIQVRR